MEAIKVKDQVFGVIASFDDATGEAIDAMAECINEIMKLYGNAEIVKAAEGSPDAGDAITVIDLTLNSALIKGDVKYKIMSVITTHETMDYTQRLQYFRENASLKSVKEARDFFLNEIVPHAGEM